MIPDPCVRVGPSFVPLTPFHQAAWQKGSATKARLVNKLELFLANVYAPRIEGSTFFSSSPLSARGRGRELYEGCGPKEVSDEYWDFFDESMRFV